VLDVRKLTVVTDTMIVATGNSDRHVKSIADRLIAALPRGGPSRLWRRGQAGGRVGARGPAGPHRHVMLPRIREFYGLEKLWDLRPAARRPSVA
jgi:ribosome-associated protein